METQTIKANISGRLFEFERDAYNRLEDYLQSFRRKLNLSPNEEDETISDLEARIAELLSAKVAEGNTVIRLEHVIRIISIVGEAEQIKDETYANSDNYDYSFSEKTYRNRGARRLYRLNRTRILGGVCSGLAEYMNIDPIWVRIVAIVSLFFSFGVSLLVYIVLWAIIPNESNVSKQASFDDIKSNVKDEYHRTKERVKDYTKSEKFQKTKQKTRDTMRKNDDVLGNILKIALVIFAVILFIKGIAWITHANPFHVHWPRVDIGDIFDDFPFWWTNNFSFLNFGVVGIFGFLLLFLPLLFIFIFVLKLITRSTKPGKLFTTFFAVFWILIFIAFLMYLTSAGGGTNFKNRVHYSYSYNGLENSTLLIKFDEDEEYDNVSYFTIFNETYIIDKKNDRILGQPEIKIRSSSKDEIEVKIEKRYFAFNQKRGGLNDLYEDFEWHLEDTVLVIDKYFEYETEDWWHNPRLLFYIYLPENQNIEISETVTEAMNNS